jgi:hypothetical protein
MKTNRSKALLCVLAALLLLGGCKDLFHPEGSAQSNSNTPGGSNITGSAPSTPSSIQANAVSSDTITVTWGSVSGASGYRVYRASSSSGTYSQIGEVYTTSHTNTGLSPNTTYYYKVSAYNSRGESARSNYYASATTSSGGSNNSLVGTTWYAPGAYGEYRLNFISPTELIYYDTLYDNHFTYSYDGSTITVYATGGYALYSGSVSTYAIYIHELGVTFYKLEY